MRNAVAILVVCALVGCGVKQLPRRATPAALPPSLDPPAQPVAEGFGRMYVDAEDGPAVVGRVTAMKEVQETRFVGGSIGLVPGSLTIFPHTVKVDLIHRDVEVLCTTPCWIDLPLGKSALVSMQPVGRPYSDLISLGPRAEPQGYRHAFGSRSEPKVGRAVLAALPLSLGITMVATSPLIALGTDGNEIPIGLAIGGAALTVIGALLFQRARMTAQEGTGLVYPLEP